MYIRFKNMIIENQIIFQFMSWICFPILTTYIGCQTHSYNSEKQLIEAAKISPIFILKMEQVKNSQTNQFDSIEVLIENQGESITEFNAENFSILTLTMNNKKITLPIHYLIAGTNYQITKGLMGKFFQPQNNAQYIKFDQSVLDYNSKIIDHKAYIDINFEIFISISYQNILKKFETKCFAFQNSIYSRETSIDQCLNAKKIVQTSKKIVDVSSLDLKTLVTELTQTKND